MKKYYLYGVEVTKEFYDDYVDGYWKKIEVKNEFDNPYVWTPKLPNKKLDAKLIFTEKNAQRRMMYINLIGIENIYKDCKQIIIEEISGEDLYKKYPIGDYLQQGDVLIKPNPIKEISFEEVSEETKERLKNIKYKLMNIFLEDNLLGRYLEMTSASIENRFHLEGVDNNCNTVFESICWRNNEKTLPHILS